MMIFIMIMKLAFAGNKFFTKDKIWKLKVLNLEFGTIKQKSF